MIGSPLIIAARGIGVGDGCLGVKDGTGEATTTFVGKPGVLVLVAIGLGLVQAAKNRVDIPITMKMSFGCLMLIGQIIPVNNLLPG